jgi:hypothetical protein
MLILKRFAAGALAFGGLMAAYLADAQASADSAEATALVVALALGCFVLAALLAWDWDSPRSRRTGPIAGLMLAALAASALAPSARAETALDRATCTPSVLRLCPAEALAADREGAKRCLIRNFGKASQACQMVIRSNLTAPRHGAGVSLTD